MQHYNSVQARRQLSDRSRILRPMPVLPRLRELRERRALSQDELARIAHLARTTIVRLEQGEAGAQAGTTRKLAKALRVKPEELMA